MEHKMESCSVDPVMDVIVGKWKISILFHLFQGTKRFSELQRGIPDITKKMLSSQLRELEEHDIIQRVVYPAVPPKVEYSLTKYGYTLEPLLRTLQQWGRAHAEHMWRKRNNVTISDSRQ